MFQISRRADYAVRIMLELGDRGEGQRLSATQVAKSTGVPLAFSRTIVRELVKAGLIRAYPGPAGGLELARAAASITTLQILEAIEGPICLNVCLVRPQECPRDVICAGHSLWGRLQLSLVQQLQDTTLDKLVAEGRELKRHPRRRDML